MRFIMENTGLQLFRKNSIHVFFVFLFIGAVNASITYDAGTNTIYLENETNTLASIYSEIGDPSVLSYDAGTNTYKYAKTTCAITKKN